MSDEYVVYADESDEDGKYYSNFFGGTLVRSRDIDRVRAVIRAAKAALNLHGEVKWQKVTANYLEKYKELIDTFFDLVESDTVKVRIMFSQNARVPQGLQDYHREHRFQLLYYQFLKNAFGLTHSNQSTKSVRVRFYLDKLPDTVEKNAQFKSFISAMSNAAPFRRARIIVPASDVTEVRSHDHDVLQCLDIVLGGIQFRLNDKHLEKPAGQTTRGKRTIAKEKLYKHINARIRRIYPNFNIGISTGRRDGSESLWKDCYRHWLFTPSGAQFDSAKTKK